MPIKDYIKRPEANLRNVLEKTENLPKDHKSERWSFLEALGTNQFYASRLIQFEYRYWFDEYLVDGYDHELARARVVALLGAVAHAVATAG